MIKMSFEPWTFAYKIFGNRVKKIVPQFQDLHTQLKRGGIQIYVAAYVSLMIMCSLITFTVSMTLFPFLLSAIVHVNPLSPQNILLSLMFALLLSLMVAIVIYAYPTMKSSQRRGPIDSNLSYISSFMTMLSISNVPARIVFRSMSRIDTLRQVHQEFASIVRDVEVFGKDLLTSIAENVKYTPSKRLQEILTGYVTTIRTGGDPTEYLKVATQNSIQERMIRLELMLESLSAMAEIYIMVLVAMPLLFIAMFSILGSIGGQGGIDPALFMYLLAYVFIPVVAIMMVVLISSISEG